MIYIYIYMLSREYLFRLLDKICPVNNNNNNKCYVVNNDSFKKLRFLNLYSQLVDDLKPFYRKSKQFYLTREPKYTGFLTILRHICKSNMVSYTSKLLYDKSKYDITYYICPENVSST